MVSKVFQKLVNDRIVDHLQKCDLFLISSMVLAGLPDSETQNNMGIQDKH